MECLEFWAKNEFLTVPQLTRVVVKKAIAEYLKQHPREDVEDAKAKTTTAKPTTAKPTTAKSTAAKSAAAKAKQGRGRS